MAAVGPGTAAGETGTAGQTAPRQPPGSPQWSHEPWPSASVESNAWPVRAKFACQAKCHIGEMEAAWESRLRLICSRMLKTSRHGSRVLAGPIYWYSVLQNACNENGEQTAGPVRVACGLRRVWRKCSQSDVAGMWGHPARPRSAALAALSLPAGSLPSRFLPPSLIPQQSPSLPLPQVSSPATANHRNTTTAIVNKKMAT